MCSTIEEKGDVSLIYLNMMFNTFLSLPNRKDMCSILNKKKTQNKKKHTIFWKQIII